MKQSVTKYIEESFTDSRNWKHVNEFVKLTFMSMLDIVKLNCTAIRELEREITNKAVKSEVASLSASKLSVSDFPVLFERYTSERSMTASMNRIEYELKAKIEEVVTGLKSKAEAKNSNTENELVELSNRLKHLQQGIDLNKRALLNDFKVLEEGLLRKADRSEVDNLCKLNQLFECQLEQLSKSLVEITRSPVAQSQINEELFVRLNQQERLLQLGNDTQDTYRTRIETEVRSLKEELKDNGGRERLQQIVVILEKQDEKRKLQEEQSQKKVISLNESILKLQKEQKLMRETINKAKQQIETLEHNQNHNSLSKLKQDMCWQTQRINQLQTNMHITLQKVEHSEKAIQCTALAAPALVEQLSHQIEDKLRGVQDWAQNKIDGKCITKGEIQSLLSHKVDVTQYKADLSKFDRQEFLDTVSTIGERHELLMMKIDQLRDEFGNFKVNDSRLNQSFSQAIDDRVSASDLKRILEKMATLSDLKLVVADFSKKLQSGGQKDKFSKFIQDQACINETLCAENIMGRWIWNTGNLKNGNLVPWQRQVINTLPENFNWQQNTTVITIVSNGLYKIELGFYSKKKPTVQIIVNGNTVLSAVNSNSYVIHHSSGKLKDIKARDNPVSGLTLVDFLLLPAKARLAISYNGEEGQGFLSLRRL